MEYEVNVADTKYRDNFNPSFQNHKAHRRIKHIDSTKVCSQTSAQLFVITLFKIIIQYLPILKLLYFIKSSNLRLQY